MALVDRSGNPVRSGNGNAIGTRSGSGNNNNNNNNSGGGGGAAREARAAEVARLKASAAALETQRRNQDRESQIKAAEAIVKQQTAASNAAAKQQQEALQAEADYNQKLQEQNQFTNVRGGTTSYPAQAPDTMFRGLGNGITGGFKGKLLDKLGNAIGPEGYVGGMLNAYNQFDPLGDFAQQTMYGMNDAAKQEYLRQESSNPNWQGMSEADRVSLARKPQIDNQNANAYIGGGQGRPNEAQLNAMRPQNISESQWAGLPQGMKSQLAQSSGMMGSMGGGGSGGGGGAFGGGYSSGTGGGYNNESGIGASVSGNNGQYFNGGYTGDAVNQLSQARSPRGMEFSNIYGTTQFDPLTGQFTEQAAPEYQQFQQGLLGQLQGSQDAYQSFDPQDAASEYLRGVNAIREPLREQQTQSALSRLIQSGKLGATAGTQALAQLETEQENQRFQEGVQATQYGSAMQDRMLRNQAGMFGLTQNVADQQFKPQQQALGSVPMLQQIYGFAQEPQFQQGLAEQGIAAQQSANNTSNWMNLGTSVLGSDVGQDLISDAWGWLTNS